MLAVVDLTLLTIVVLCTTQLLVSAAPELAPCECCADSDQRSVTPALIPGNEPGDESGPCATGLLE